MSTDDGLDIDLLAASLRADLSDLGAFVEALATKLEEAVPGAVRVQRRGKMFGAKRVSQIAVDAGGQRLELSVNGSRIETRCARLSGGIVLRSEPLDTETWLTALSAALAEQARSSQTTRQALDRLLNG